MKRTLVSALILASVLVLAVGCGGVTKLELREPWADGEVFELELAQHGQVLGVITHSIWLDGDCWVLNSLTETGDWSEETTVHVQRGTLQPVRTGFLAKAGDDRVTYTAVYGPRQVDLEAERPDGSVTAEIRLPDPPYFENEQFLMLLRALPLEEGFSARINLVVTRTATKTQLSVRVVDRETVTTPLGDIDAWKVELVGANQFGWVEVDPPHRVIRYDNVTAGTMSLLRDYRADGEGGP